MAAGSFEKAPPATRSVEVRARSSDIVAVGGRRSCRHDYCRISRATASFSISVAAKRVGADAVLLVPRVDCCSAGADVRKNTGVPTRRRSGGTGLGPPWASREGIAERSSRRLVIARRRRRYDKGDRTDAYLTMFLATTRRPRRT